MGRWEDGKMGLSVAFERGLRGSGFRRIGGSGTGACSPSSVLTIRLEGSKVVSVPVLRADPPGEMGSLLRE